MNIPKTMRCREFEPTMGKFCANPADFVSPTQILEMAKFFGFARNELKKIKIVAEQRVAEDAAQQVGA
jgi:hypothetical protein